LSAAYKRDQRSRLRRDRAAPHPPAAGIIWAAGDQDVRLCRVADEGHRYLAVGRPVHAMGVPAGGWLRLETQLEQLGDDPRERVLTW
jgi:hypothetical protein